MAKHFEVWLAIYGKFSWMINYTMHFPLQLAIILTTIHHNNTLVQTMCVREGGGGVTTKVFNVSKARNAFPTGSTVLGGEGQQVSSLISIGKHKLWNFHRY